MSHHHSLQRQLHLLAQQNEALRVKAQKIHQIQSYVNVLIHSSQSSKQQLNRSHQENRSMKIRIDQMMAESVKLEQHYQHEIGFMEGEFMRQLQRKDEEVRALAVARQKQAQIYEQKISEQQVRAKNDMQRLRLQLFSLQKQSQDQIHQLTSLLTQKSHQLQLNEDSKNQLKKAYLEQSNNIKSQVSKLQRAYHQSQNQVFSLKQQLGRLSQVLDQFSANQALLKRELARKEEEVISDRKSFEKRIRLLQENINELTVKQKKALNKVNQSTLHNQKLLKQLQSLSQQFTDLKHHSSKLQRLINEKDQQLKQMNIKIQQQEEEHKRHLKRHNEQLLRAEEELNLASERFLCEKRNADAMKGEIEDLLKVIDKLEGNLAQSEHNLEMVNKENAVLFKQVENITKQLKYRIQQLNDIDSKYKQSRQNYIGLQQIYKKQSNKSQTLTKENTEIIARLQSITRQQKALQEQELSNLIEKHLAEKREMLESHRVEKEAMGKKFEQALREKDEQLRKRLELLEDEISLMRVRH